MDKIFYIIFYIISILIVAVVGDFLHLSIVYYLFVPVVAYLLSLPFKPKAFYLSGIGLTILLSYVPYIFYYKAGKNIEGLMGLGHLFSLFGLGLGIILAGFYIKGKKNKPVVLFMISLVFSLSGFLLNQLIVCNTVLYCGGLFSFLI
ncbi:hypothetical protein [Motilimonas sp. E26]|uniref:hypothetical protein n=1 Tax=Motilimonas sp. E26 TaxID=2865674 RepID=UPI001E2CBC97|nr:hypothetical protein [Motilimonas sp. E26]MCE0555587.1 hypothetical protein [Motilimonas sp. E26]